VHKYFGDSVVFGGGPRGGTGWPAASFSWCSLIRCRRSSSSQRTRGTPNCKNTRLQAEVFWREREM